MASRPIEPLHYDASGVLIEGSGLSQNDLEDLAPRLKSARGEVLKDVEQWNCGDEVPPEKVPLDAGFLKLPERILSDYRQKRASSELAQILDVARRLSEQVDRVIVLGIGGSFMGARALMESCCHPYHNELGRAERGGRPRVYFEGNNVDNDAVQGLLDLVKLSGSPKTMEQRWAIVVISKSGGTLETAVAFRTFLAALDKTCSGDPSQRAQLVVPVTGPGGRLRTLANALGCQDIFTIPNGVGGRFSIFSAVGLLPAAILGLDVVRLLEGAEAMNAHFISAEPGSNTVLDFVAACHLMERNRGATIRVLSIWGKGLEATGLWYDQLLAESLGKDQRGATPLTSVNTRDLHSRGQQHQEGRRDKLITNLIVDNPRCDRVTVGHSQFDQDQLNALADKALPDIMQAALRGTNEAYTQARRPTANLHLPRLDESSMGQLFQMFMLATVVEGRLVGTNPYGQPGVNAYKKNMNAILRGQ